MTELLVCSLRESFGSVCSKRFVTKEELAAHRNDYHSSNWCSVCEIYFDDSSLRSGHEKTHPKCDLYGCEMKGTHFKDAEAFEQHVLRVHRKFDIKTELDALNKKLDDLGRKIDIINTEISSRLAPVPQVPTQPSAQQPHAQHALDFANVRL